MARPPICTYIPCNRVGSEARAASDSDDELIGADPDEAPNFSHRPYDFMSVYIHT